MTFIIGVEVKELEGKDLSHDANSKGALQYLTAEKRGTLLELLRHRKEYVCGCDKDRVIKIA